eukprot:CAMPEP_0194325796 /NCGR_PEP_ID=MMETSP0171-20130528/32774_1 /TAXON_ID=218684 /ORGANISM="Corethron pennatum, Strain L29A3" /LENGTH=220 /DNA_ID=CAMNT_0039085087 /DNA_START=41 /DNA_END=699 /DNA_ORIENTATION=-
MVFSRRTRVLASAVAAALPTAGAFTVAPPARPAHPLPFVSRTALASSPAAPAAPAAGTASYCKCSKCLAYFPLDPSQLGPPRSKGRRVSCPICPNMWYQSRDRLFDLGGQGGQWEMVPLEEKDFQRIKDNIEAGRSPDFKGVAKLYVGNLSFNTVDEELETLFATVGDVGDVVIVRQEDGRSKGFGFVTMVTEEDGRKAEGLDGTEVAGRALMVKKPREG